MTIESIPGNEQKYYLIAFNESGQQRPDDPDGRMSDRIVRAMQEERPTDVFVMSHGWKGDLPAAREQYSAWMGVLLSETYDLAAAAAQRPNFKPLLIGIHWPSLPFGDEDLTASPGVSFDQAGDDSVEALVERYACRLTDTPASRAALRTIFAAARVEVAPVVLPAPVRDAYRTLDREMGLGCAGVAGSPSDDREPFDPDVAYGNALAEAASFGGTPLGGLLSPLVQLSFWKMKDRGKVIGETGGFAFLSSLLDASDGRDVRFHVMGHSFGCIVASASIVGPKGSKLPRAVNSLALVQGALSLWSYCSDIPHCPGKVGYFHRLVDEHAVAGPIVTTQSTFDTAVGTLYPLAAGVADQVAMAPELPKFGGVGTYGARGPGLDVVDLQMRGSQEAYAFQAGLVYNLDGSAVIREGRPPSGAHSDIAKPEVAHAIWAAALAR